jgi:mRNA interferase MazF
VQRGEIYLIELDPAIGSESNKTRPAVIVSSNAVNSSAERRGRGIVSVVPLSSNVRQVFRFQVLLLAAESGLPLDSKAQAEQIRSVSTERLVRRLGAIDGDRMRQLDDALRLHLSL